jgi:hypothetical protein
MPERFAATDRNSSALFLIATKPIDDEGASPPGFRLARPLFWKLGCPAS